MTKSSKVWMMAALTTGFLAAWGVLAHAGQPRQPDDSRHQAEFWIRQGEAQLPSEAEEAIQSFQRSLGLAYGLNDSSLISNSLAGLAGAYLELAEPKKALPLATEALTIARRAGDPRREAWALDQLGNAWFHLGDFAKALESFREAAAKMEQAGDLLGKATALRDAGVTLRYLDQYDEGLELLYEALLIFRKLKATTQVASVLDNLGLAYFRLGAHRLALSALNEAIEVARQNKNRPALFAALLRVGYLYRDLNKPGRAILYLEEALAIAKELRLISQEEEARSVISAALFDLGRGDEAIEIQMRFLRAHRKQKDEKRAALDLCALGAFHADRSPKLAAHYFQSALTVLQRQTSLRESVYIAYNHLAQLDRRQGRLDYAIQNYQRSIAYLEEHRSHLTSQYHRATFFAKHRQVYEGLVEAMTELHASSPRADEEVRVFTILELAKARDLSDAISERNLGTRQGLDPQHRWRQDEVSARIAELQKLLVQPGITAEKSRQVANDVNQLEQEFDRLLVRTRQRDQSPSQRRKTIALQELQLLLNRRTALITYLMTKEQLLAFVVTSQTIHLEGLPAAPRSVSARVQNFEDLIAQNDAGWRDVAQRLYAELFAPLRQSLPPNIDRLMIVGDGILHYLPFETLISEPVRSEDAKHAAPQSRFLLDDFAISYVPSATVLAQLKTSAASRLAATRADLVMFANPELTLAPQVPRLTHALYDDEGLQVAPIPYSGVEANLIARYAGAGSEILTGAQANERRVKTQAIDRFRIVHFATHGLISERAPNRSALVLSLGQGGTEDGFLQAREIRELKLASDLVVLSACETSRGRIVAGEGVQGLAQAFLEAGTQSVVAPLWRVNDKRTATFMEMFYGHLADGKCKVDALRAAKLDLLRLDPAVPPRDWAPFILIGEEAGRIPIKGLAWWRRNGLWWLFLSGVSITGLAVMLLSFRRKHEKVASM